MGRRSRPADGARVQRLLIRVGVALLIAGLLVALVGSVFPGIGPGSPDDDGRTELSAVGFLPGATDRTGSASPGVERLRRSRHAAADRTPGDRRRSAVAVDRQVIHVHSIGKRSSAPTPPNAVSKRSPSSESAGTSTVPAPILSARSS